MNIKNEKMKEELMKAFESQIEEAVESESRAIREANIRDHSRSHHGPMPMRQRRARHFREIRHTAEPKNPFKRTERQKEVFDKHIQSALDEPYTGDFGADVRNSRGYVMMEWVTVPCMVCDAKVGQPCEGGGIHMGRRKTFIKFANTEEGRKIYHNLRRHIEASGNPRVGDA